MPAASATLVKPKKTSRVARGIATNDLVFSAYSGTNDEVFPNVLKLYVPRGSKIADVTFGQGVFWKKVEKDAYKIRPSDIKLGIDCRALPYENASFDCVVLDPPYMHTPGGTAHQNHQITSYITLITVLRFRRRNITKLSSIFTSAARKRRTEFFAPAEF